MIVQFPVSGAKADDLSIQADRVLTAVDGTAEWSIVIDIEPVEGADGTVTWVGKVRAEG